MSEAIAIGVGRALDRDDGVLSLHVGDRYVLLSREEARALADDLSTKVARPSQAPPHAETSIEVTEQMRAAGAYWVREARNLGCGEHDHEDAEHVYRAMRKLEPPGQIVVASYSGPERRQRRERRQWTMIVDATPCKQCGHKNEIPRRRKSDS